MYYALLFATTLPLLDIFFIKWFTPAFEFSSWLSGWAIAASVFQVACTLIPETGGWRVKIHQLLAGLSALCLLPAAAIIALGGTMELPVRLFSFACFGVMLGVLFVVFRAQYKQLLLLQIVYFGAFFLPILAIAYL